MRMNARLRDSWKPPLYAFTGAGLVGVGMLAGTSGIVPGLPVVGSGPTPTPTVTVIVDPDTAARASAHCRVIAGLTPEISRARQSIVCAVLTPAGVRWREGASEPDDGTSWDLCHPTEWPSEGTTAAATMLAGCSEGARQAVVDAYSHGMGSVYEWPPSGVLKALWDSVRVDPDGVLRAHP